MKFLGMVVAVAVGTALPIVTYGADLGESLRALTGLKGMVDKVITGQGKGMVQEHAHPAIDNFCATLQANPLVNEYVAAMTEASKYRISHPLDSGDRLLAQWVDGQLIKTPISTSTKEFAEFSNKVYKEVNKCVYALKDTPYIHMFDDGNGYLKKAINDYERRMAPQRNARVIDANGNISTANPNMDLPRFITSPYQQGPTIRSTPEWAALYALVLPGGVDVMNEIAGDVPTQLLALAKNKAEIQAQRIADAQAEEKQRQQEAEMAQRESAVAEAEAAKPDNQLRKAYQTYQMMDKCVKVRDGYVQVYLTVPELEMAKNSVKKIEDKLKSSLVNSTDYLWAEAAKLNNDNMYYKTLDISGFKNGREVCELAKMSMGAIANNILGDQVPEKDF